MIGERRPILFATLIVLDGALFHVKTHVAAEIIDGKAGDLSNHQRELFEFYEEKNGINQVQRKVSAISL